MFERFIRLAKAKKALRDRCFEDALALAADPLIRSDRRAEEVRDAAVAELLARARRHLAANDLDAARAEVARVRSLAPAAAVDELAAAVATATSADQDALDFARRAVGEARKLLGRGETAAMRALLATVAPSHLLFERDQLEKLLVERQRDAVDVCRAASEALRSGQVAAAVEGLHRAAALDRDAAVVPELRARVVATMSQQVGQAVQVALDRGDPVAALDHYRVALQQLPELGADDRMGSVRAGLSAFLRRRMQEVSSLDQALPLADAVLAVDLLGDDALSALASAIVLAANRTGRGEGGAVAQRLREAAEAVAVPALVAAADGLARSATATDARLAVVHAKIDAGELEAARRALLDLLAEEPLHEAARRELGLVEQGLVELDRRLEAARGAARAGRLREACTAALALAGSSRVADEAQQVVADVRARMAVVDRGLDEVRVALHGRLAAGVEGVRHCLRRLEELAKVQIDHEQLPAVIQAVGAEITALGLCDNATKAVERQALDEAFPLLLELLPLCERLIARDRLEARLCALADRIAVAGEGAVAAGRLAAADRCAELLALLQPIRSEFAERAAALRATAAQRRERAEALVAEAGESLSRRDLGEAERLAEAALAQWTDGPSVRGLTGRLADLRRQTDALARVDAMTKEQDYLGAQQKLAAMPPTQALLRTRIYDMKQNLARAQGLEGAFLLRVDEGGEHLVMRGESVSLGNVRQARADLPVLANLAGVHASVRRSMSFHGGMQDTVVAAEGEVRVGGAVVAQHTLVPGDRVVLGSSFGFVYQRPTARSLSATLVLQGGFQVAGTDRIVLMKDRGRDGRILVGSGKDVHVRVPKATGEVEIFATNNGQVRVACEAGGTIDGVPFRGEHPIAAGQVVQAVGVSFLLMPWRPTV